MLKILFQARLQQYVNVNFQVFKLVLEKAEEPEIKLPTSAGSRKKQESARKTSISALLTMPKQVCQPLCLDFTSARPSSGKGVGNMGHVCRAGGRHEDFQTKGYRGSCVPKL